MEITIEKLSGGFWGVTFEYEGEKEKRHYSYTKEALLALRDELNKLKIEE